MVVVAMNFFLQHCSPFFQGSELLEGTGAEDTILEPAIVAFHFPFDLGGEGINHVYLDQYLRQSGR